MSIVEKPIIKTLKKGNTYTKITFIPDYNRFKCTEKNINNDYLKKILIDIAFSL